MNNLKYKTSPFLIPTMPECIKDVPVAHLLS